MSVDCGGLPRAPCSLNTTVSTRWLTLDVAMSRAVVTSKAPTKQTHTHARGLKVCVCVFLLLT